MEKDDEGKLLATAYASASAKSPIGRTTSGDHHVLAALLQKTQQQMPTITSTTTSTTTTSGLDRETLLERLNRFKYHLADSLIEQLLQQIQREEESHQHQQQQQRSLASSASVTSRRSPSADDDDDHDDDNDDKLQQIQAQMLALEAKADRHATNMTQLFEFEMMDDNASSEISISSNDDSEDDEDEDEDDTEHYGDSFSSNFEVMPLGGEPVMDDQADKPSTTTNTASLQDYLEKQIYGERPETDGKSVTSKGSQQEEALVTKIGRTRMNRALRKSPCPSVSGNEASSVTEGSYDPAEILAATAKLKIKKNGVPMHQRQQQQSAGSMPDLLLQQNSMTSSVRTPEFIQEQQQLERLLIDKRKSAICFIDISGFTNLSRALDVEDLSMVRGKSITESICHDITMSVFVYLFIFFYFF
jgi:hypothetical protein